MNNENLEPVQKLTPFTKMVMSIGTLPSSFYASMSYYESMVWLYEYLKNTVIPTVNGNAEAVEELQEAYVTLKNYIDTYFDNLDLQEEVNKKLDEMAEDGTITNLIKQYIDPLYQEYELEINTRLNAQDGNINAFKNTVNGEIDTINTKVDNIASGSPLVVDNVSGMTDTTRVYVNTTNGNWYYYDGDSWEIGGVYQATGINPNDPIISGLTDNVEAINEDLTSYLIERKPYSRQLYNVDTMIPETAYQISMQTSTLKMVTATSYRCFPLEINGTNGETYSYNFVNFSGSFVDLMFVASNNLPANEEYCLQLGSSSAANKRGSITLSQDSKYLLLFMKLTSPTSPPEDVTTASNSTMGYIVIRKGSIPDEPTYYEYAEYVDYKVVPYEQGLEDAGKVLSINEYGIVTPTELNNVGGNISYNATQTIYVGNNLLDSSTTVNLGPGWSGTFDTGFTHTAGNTAALEFNLNTDAESKYLVNITGTASGDGKIGIQIGNEPIVDVYNGTVNMEAGFISDGGKLKIIPLDESLSIRIYDIKLRKLQNDGTEIVLQNKNVNQGQMTDNITGFWNAAFGGDSTLAKNQNGSRNIGIGTMSLSELKSGTRNIGIGTFALAYVKEGDRNIAIGSDSLYDVNSIGLNRKAYDNIAIGKACMKTGSNIHDNIALGTAAMSDCTDTTNSNIAIGSYAGAYADYNNTHIGYHAGYYTKGNGNTSLGYNAMSDTFNTGDNNIAIGNGAGTKADNSSSTNIVTINNSIAIGTNVKAKASNQVVIGDSSQTFILGNRRIIFNNDGSISWTNI